MQIFRCNLVVVFLGTLDFVTFSEKVKRLVEFIASFIFEPQGIVYMNLRILRYVRMLQ